MLIDKNFMSKPQLSRRELAKVTTAANLNNPSDAEDLEISSPYNDNLSRNNQDAGLPKFELIAVESIVPGKEDNPISPRRYPRVGIGLIKSDITKPANSFLQQLEEVKKEESGHAGSVRFNDPPDDEDAESSIN